MKQPVKTNATAISNYGIAPSATRQQLSLILEQNPINKPVNYLKKNFNHGTWNFKL